MEPRPCSHGCGRMLDPRGAHKHEATCPGIEPMEGHESPAPKARTGQDGAKKRGRPSSTVRTPLRAKTVLRAAQALAKELPPCEGCPGSCLRGLKVPELRLVERGIRGGMFLGEAAELIRAAQAAK